MNEIILRGYLRDTRYSHTINGIDYNKANIIVPNAHTGDDDIISLCYKQYTNKYEEGKFIEIAGNVRSYSQKLDDNKNKVSIYVFTYFDLPNPERDAELNNKVYLDGRICKMGELRRHTSGPDSLSFILANNIILPEGRGKINNYIPIVCWGAQAHEVQNLSVGNQLMIEGTLQSRVYKKQLGDSMELRTAHEIIASEVSIL